MMRGSICCLAALVVLSETPVINQAGGPAAQAARPAPSATLAAKKPVFAGACRACPWGILAKVTADALKLYGYDTTICWVCATTQGPRQVGDSTKPPRQAIRA